jgi:recombination associated protein RdgC
MWFKQAQIFQLTNAIPFQSQALEDKLEPLAFRPCLPSFASGHGWTSPQEQEGAALVHAANGYLLICMQLEEKVLPATVIRQELNERVSDIQTQQERKVSQKEKRELKEEIIIAFLTRAFSKLSRVYGLIDTKNDWLILDTTSASRIEKFLALFKKSMGETTYQSIETKKVAPELTQWVSQGHAPKAFAIDQSCVLRDPQQQTRTVRCQHQDLSVEAIQAFLADGFEVHQLLLNWQDKMTFTLVDDFTLKAIRYHEEVISLAKDSYSETEQEQFDADFFIVTELLSELFALLLKTFAR